MALADSQQARHGEHADVVARYAPAASACSRTRRRAWRRARHRRAWPPRAAIISSSEWPSRLMACAGHCDAHAPHAWQVSASKYRKPADLDAWRPVRAHTHARQARRALLAREPRTGGAAEAALRLSGGLVLRVALLDLVEASRPPRRTRGVSIWMRRRRSVLAFIVSGTWPSTTLSSSSSSSASVSPPGRAADTRRHGVPRRWRRSLVSARSPRRPPRRRGGRSSSASSGRRRSHRAG